MSISEPLVLVPGLLCTAELWLPQVDALGDIVDIRVADHTAHDTMVDTAADILNTAPDRFALAGLSMGGYVSLEIMRQAPERVTRLALLDTSARADTPEQVKRRSDFIKLSEIGKFHGVTETLLPILIHETRLGDEALVATIYRMAQTVGQTGFVRQQRAIMSRSDSRDLLGRISCPALVLCGRQDQLTPLDLHREMAAGIPSSELVVLEDCGHLSTLERPDQVNAAMRDWLTEEGKTPA